MTKKVNIRELVMRILTEVCENGGYSHKVIGDTLKKHQYLEKKDRAFISRLAEGTIEQSIRIDYVLNCFSTVKTTKMKPTIRNILRLSVYQILFMDGVKDFAACNEGVELASRMGYKNLKGFVNGVLRNISRNADKISYPSETKEPALYLSIYYSMPRWLVDDWIKIYGYNVTKDMFDKFLSDQPTTIRCNLNKTTIVKLTDLLKEQNITVKSGEYLEYVLKISDYDYIDQIQGFNEGLFQIQDESSILLGQIASPKEGDIIIDVCAAPGGKSLHLAEKLKDSGRVYARDITLQKTQKIEENIKRLGYKNITVEVMDALIKDKDSINKADIVIADLPCSGLGVIGKKTDIKYKTKKEDVIALSKLQKDILTTINEYIKEDGILIFSTCTLQREENIDNVLWFINNFPFELESIDPYIPDILKDENTKKGYLEMIPGKHKSDGFFIARLRKKNNNG